MNKDKMDMVMRVISWCVGWNLMEEATALKDLVAEYELLKLELADRRDDG